METLFNEMPSPAHDKTFQIKPFLKWAGGKFRILEEIKSKLPSDGNRYIEPFLGGGSVALNINYRDVIASDVNKDLVNVYVYLRDLGEDFIQMCLDVFSSDHNGEETYYNFRNEFNSSKDLVRKAVLFLYLNKHCYNGLCRYNSKGIFNTPIGGLRRATCPTIEMRLAIPKLKKMKILTRGFEESLKDAGEGDIVYCDPPYLPINLQAFVQYAKSGFNQSKQIELARLSREAANRGAFVLVSNHDTEYARDLYEKQYGAYLTSLDVRRSIGGENAKRGKVSELLAIFRP